MDLSRFAHQVLTGSSLADKLLDVPIDGDGGWRGPVPERPSRDAHLAIAPASSRAPLPKAAQLDDPAARAALLHSFANHELLALELMAHALLRFPDAPVGFRRGLLTVLQDEQAHLRLYLDRLRALGLDFGALPLNGFFWDTVADAPSPLDLVARLSLVFEQANLDFARSFSHIFAEAGDPDSAALLQRVYTDELRHVRHGLGWLRRWKDPALTDWQAWVSRLQEPLGPSRAKGLGYHAASRREVGFDADYVQRLTLWRRSRGRPPALWWMNPLCEIEASGAPLPGRLLRLEQDLALLPAAICPEDDAVLVPALPHPDWMADRAAAGLGLPQLIAVGTGPLPKTDAIDHKRVSALHPWGASPRSDALQARLGDRLTDPSPPASAAVFSKAWSQPLRQALLGQLHDDFPGLLADPGAAGQVVTQLDALDLARAMLTPDGGRCVVKAPWGSAGHGALRVDAGPLPQASQRWVSGLLAQQGALVVEPWLDRVLDLSLHGDILGDGSAKMKGWNLFWADRTGRFTAASAAGMRPWLPGPLARWLSADGQQPDRLEALGARILAAPGAGLGGSGPCRPRGRRRLRLSRRAGRLAAAAPGRDQPPLDPGPLRDGAEPQDPRRAAGLAGPAAGGRPGGHQPGGDGGAPARRIPAPAARGAHGGGHQPAHRPPPGPRSPGGVGRGSGRGPAAPSARRVTGPSRPRKGSWGSPPA